jgi:hypothetical protein
VLGQTIFVTATATGIVGPHYEFWYETPAGQWRSTAGYQAFNGYAFTATMPGVYHVIAYARPPGVPINPDAAERLATEAQSPMVAVRVVWLPVGG